MSPVPVQAQQRLALVSRALRQQGVQREFEESLRHAGALPSSEVEALAVSAEAGLRTLLSKLGRAVESGNVAQCEEHLLAALSFSARARARRAILAQQTTAVGCCRAA